MRTDPRIPRLLAGSDRLSRVEKDAIRERVLRASAPPSKRRRGAALVAALTASAAAAAAILFLVARDGGDRRQEEPEFASRGRAAHAAAFDLSCGDSGSPCRPGQKLVFDLGRSAGYRYFAAFSRREDGAVVWYFPAPGETSIDLSVHLDHGVLTRAVLLDAQHPPGRYRVFGILSDAPLGREEIRQRFQPERTDIGPDTAVVARELVIQ